MSHNVGREFHLISDGRFDVREKMEGIRGESAADGVSDSSVPPSRRLKCPINPVSAARAYHRPRRRPSVSLSIHFEGYPEEANFYSESHASRLARVQRWCRFRQYSSARCVWLETTVPKFFTRAT